MTFIDLLYNRVAFPPPPLGVGRIHTIDDAKEEIPDQSHRFSEIIQAIRAGEATADAILKRLPFAMPKAMLIADCEELAERGLARTIRSGPRTLYAPS